MSSDPSALHAKHPSFAATPGPREVVALVFPGALLLNAAGPLEVFAAVPRVLPAFAAGAPYRIRLASRDGGLVDTVSGIAVATASLAEIDAGPGPLDTLIVIGGPGVDQAEHDQTVATWLAARAAGVRRICSIGSGAFVLAAAGLLSGRRAVTHWKFADGLQRRHPDVQVERQALYLQDGELWTSGGAAAGIDLGLALVEQDLGPSAALDLARYFTVFLQRSAGQPQISAPLKAQGEALRHDRGQRLAQLHGWIAEHLGDDLRVERLAERAGMSPRHFARAYVEATGSTPAQAVEALRLEAACRWLEAGDEALKHIAATLGFGNEERLRRLFQRRLGCSPQAYRRQARALHPPGAGQTGYRHGPPLAIPLDHLAV